MPLTVEFSLLLTVISVCSAVYFGLANKQRNDKKDMQSDAEERTATNTMVLTKLENIADDVKDIKRDYRETRQEVQHLRDRVIAVEQSLKSYHKRLDGKSDQ